MRHRAPRRAGKFARESQKNGKYGPNVGLRKFGKFGFGGPVVQKPEKNGRFGPNVGLQKFGKFGFGGPAIKSSDRVASMVPCVNPADDKTDDDSMGSPFARGG